ncbi:hypothetical protein [Opitutus sp. ER46]|uniref:hypothetical protein n=1 Tax=Opitutus sp. ER46 TaxID=2161864 RepID=UPI000D305B25|nr:hypothetical protein [Opitutus sp. ER46]PTX98482.1 hypothetical protein DB354_04225 [Opitutus sp. ER46]
MFTAAKLWPSLAATPLGELVTGTAHQAHPTDVTAPLGVRFAGQNVLAIHIALEKAATVRVAFDRQGQPRLSGIRNIRQRASADFVDVLRAEAAAAHAHWAVVVLAAGWQAVLGQRAARADATEPRSSFARHRLMMETPEAVIPRAQPDRLYTAVDHPVLDRSVVFSVRRADVEDLSTQIRKAGLGVAAIRIGVAAQLEAWLAREADGGLARDLVLTDGLSALLLNTEHGDFVPPRGAVEADQPRQAVQRPGAVDEDIARFINANGGRSLTFIGPEELCAAVKKHAPAAELVRPPDHPAHDTQNVTLAAAVQHDLNPEAREVRPALPRSWRRLILGSAGLAAVLAVVAIVNTAYAVRITYDCYRLERAAAGWNADTDGDRALLARAAADLADATALRTWVASSFHAQRFAYRLLRDIPGSAALDKLQLELRDGQLALTFVVLGDQDAQLAAHRAVEQAIKELRFKIGSEELPVGMAGSARAIQYRLHLIVPDAAEVAAS